MAGESEILTDSNLGKDLSTEIVWNNENRSLLEFRNDSNLPCVCKFSEDDSRGKVSGGLKIYCQQPVYFYSHHSRRQVHARTIYHDVNGPYYEVGQTLVIPENFEGWFELVPPDFGKGKVFQSFADIAAVMPRKIFTRTPVTGIRIVDAEDGNQSYVERKIPAGSILCINSTFCAKWKTSAETGVHKKKKQEWTTMEIKYLKCTDIDEKEVLVPLTARGRFNSIYEKGSNDVRCVFRIKDLISDFETPLKVRLVFGKAPVVPCIFTGMLVLKDVITEDFIVASTATNRRNVLFEIPLKTPCNVQTAENHEQFEDSKTFMDAQKLCEKYGKSFASMIKLSPMLDTDQQMIQHIPTEKSKQRDSSLKTLDLITNISLTDDEPADRFMESDTDSIKSSEQSVLPKGVLMEMSEIKRRSTTNC